MRTRCNYPTFCPELVSTPNVKPVPLAGIKHTHIQTGELAGKNLHQKAD